MAADSLVPASGHALGRLGVDRRSRRRITRPIASRRGVDRRRAARRVAVTHDRGKTPRSRRAITCSAWPSPRRAAYGRPTRRIRGGVARRRTSRASTTAPGDSDYLWKLFDVTRAQRLDQRAEGHALVDRSRRRAPTSTGSCNGAGPTTRPGASPTTAWAWVRPASFYARRLRGSRRGSDLPRTRAPVPPTCDPDRRRRAPAAAWLQDDSAETGFLSGSAGAASCCSSGTGVTRSPRPRRRAPAAGLVDAQGVDDAVGRAPLAARERRRVQRVRFELGAAASPGSTSRGPFVERRAIPRVARGAAVWPGARDRRGSSRETPAEPPRRSTSGSTAAPPGSAGFSRIRRRRSRPEQNRAAARSALASLRAAAAATARRVLVREPDRGSSSAARGAVVALGRAGIAAFGARIAGGSGTGPAGCPGAERDLHGPSGWSSLGACPREEGAMAGPDGEQGLEAPRFEPLARHRATS